MIVGMGSWNGLASVDYAASMAQDLRTRIREITKLDKGLSPINTFDANTQSQISFVAGTGVRWKNVIANGLRMGYGTWQPTRNYGGKSCKRFIFGVCLARDGSNNGHPVVMYGNFPQDAGGYKTGWLGAGTSATGNVFVEVVVDYGVDDYVSVYYNGTLTLKVKMSNIGSISIGSLNATTDINGGAIAPFLRPEINGLLEFKQWYYAVNGPDDVVLDEPRGAFYVGKMNPYGREDGDEDGGTPPDFSSQYPIINSTLPYTAGVSSPRVTLAPSGGKKTDFRFDKASGTDISVIAVATRTLGMSSISGLNSGVEQTITVGGEVKKSTNFVPLTSATVQGNYQNVLQFSTPKDALEKGDVKVSYSSVKV